MVLLGTLTACGGCGTGEPPHSLPAQSKAPPEDAAAHDRLVLRFRQTGGIAGRGGPGSLPDFSVYSSGRALVPSRSGTGLEEFRLKPDALKRLLHDARAAGLGRAHTVGSEQIPDATALEFTMDGARTRIVQPEAQKDPAVGFRKRLDPYAWPPGDLLAPHGPYAPARVVVLAGEGAAGTKVKDWPLAPLGKGRQAAGGLCTEVDGAKVPATDPGTVWRSEGKIYSVRLRPLLPDESSCRDI